MSFVAEVGASDHSQNMLGFCMGLKGSEVALCIINDDEGLTVRV